MAVDTGVKASLTIEEALLQISDKFIDRFNKSIEEMSRRMAESSAAADAKIAESKAATDAKIAESKAAADAKIAESKAATDAIIAAAAEESKKYDAEIARLTKMNNELLKEIRSGSDALDKWVGYFGNSIGNIVELVLIPGIKQKMNELGHNFNALSPRKQYFRKNGKTYAEVDLLLENGEEIMVVEVKTQMSVKEVERQLKRLELLRKHESGSSLKGKTIYSAVAGLKIDEDAREMALGLGMYVVEIVEDTKSVNIIKPPGKPGKW